MEESDKEKLTAEQKKEIWDEIKDKLREAQDNAPAYSLGDLLRLIAIVQDRAPEAGEALTTLIQRYFTRRRVLFIIEERLRLEDVWKLELSPDEWGEFHPQSYEQDVAPVPVFETIMECGDFVLGELKYRMRKTVRNKIVNKATQGRGIDTKEAKMEYRLKELPDKNTLRSIPRTGTYYALNKPEEVRSSEMNSSEDDTLWDTDRFNSSKIVDPWDPREIVDITEEDKPQWEVISKAIPLLDDIEQALVKSIMYKIPITKISKDTGIPESTLRSRKSRLLAKFRKNATKEPSLSVLYIGNKSSAKTGQAPTTKLDRRRPRNI